MLGFEDSCHQDGDTAAEAGKQVQVDSEPGRREADPENFHQSVGPHDVWQLPQILEEYSAVIYKVRLKSNESGAITFFINN
jgi:hypothetical protein